MRDAFADPVLVQKLGTKRCSTSNCQIAWNKQDMDSAGCAGLPQAETEAEREKLKQMPGMPGMPVAPPEKCLGCRDPE